MNESQIVKLNDKYNFYKLEGYYNPRLKGLLATYRGYFFKMNKEWCMAVPVEHADEFENDIFNNS